MRPAPSAPTLSGDFTWSASLREAGLLLLIALVATAGSWFLRGDRLPLTADPVVYELEIEAPLMEISEALARYDEGDYLFVDARTRTGEDFQTIPGAFLIQESSFSDDLLRYFDFMTPEDNLIIFGDGNLLQVSNTATLLKDRGYPNLFILKGGLTAWRRAGGEIAERKEAGS
jgi:rhodanese-related sulfurtransferase